MINLDCLTRITVTPFVLVILCGACSCLKIVAISVPPLADLREPISLACSYDTGQAALYSVKWYKDDHEFYRYMPTHEPSVQTFPLEGAKLDISPGDITESCGKSQCSVRLEQLSPSASGAYTCEVSTEAPTFRTALETRNMTVAAFLLEEPRIEGLRSAYTIGDVLDITCKSAPSAPAAQLTMFVNNKEVEQNDMTKMEVPVDDLSSTSARIRKILSREDFTGGAVRVVCSAALAAVPAPARSSAAMAVLNDNQLLHNQKLEWPNDAARKSVSTASIVILTSLQLFCRLIIL